VQHMAALRRAGRLDQFHRKDCFRRVSPVIPPSREAPFFIAASVKLGLMTTCCHPLVLQLMTPRRFPGAAVA
jgi:hypothetical protein